MFQFSGFATSVSQSSTVRVAPFGHRRIKGRLHLPAAFRSLPRPSSPPGAKASPMRPSFASIFSTKTTNSLLLLRRIVVCSYTNSIANFAGALSCFFLGFNFCFSSFPFHYDFLPVLSMNFLQPSSCNTSSSLAQAWAYPKNIYRS